MILRALDRVSVTGVDTMQAVLATVAKLKAALASPSGLPGRQPGEAVFVPMTDLPNVEQEAG